MIFRDFEEFLPRTVRRITLLSMQDFQRPEVPSSLIIKASLLGLDQEGFSNGSAYGDLIMMAITIWW